MSAMKEILSEVVEIWTTTHPGFTTKEATDYIMRSSKPLSYWRNYAIVFGVNPNEREQKRHIVYSGLTSMEVNSILSRLHNRFRFDPRYLESDIILRKHEELGLVAVDIFGDCGNLDILNLNPVLEED